MTKLIVAFRNFPNAPTNGPKRTVVLLVFADSKRHPVTSNNVLKLNCVSQQPFLKLEICKAVGLCSCSDRFLVNTLRKASRRVLFC